MRFSPLTVAASGQGHLATIEDNLTGDHYVIDPLGQRGAFYSYDAANDLSIAHAATANRLGLASLPHARKV